MILQLKATHWAGCTACSCVTLQAELRKELVPLKKHLRCLYEAKQECDDTTVHIKVSIKNKRRGQRDLGESRTDRLLTRKHFGGRGGAGFTARTDRGGKKKKRLRCRVSSRRPGRRVTFSNAHSEKTHRTLAPQVGGAIGGENTRSLQVKLDNKKCRWSSTECGSLLK